MPPSQTRALASVDATPRAHLRVNGDGCGTCCCTVEGNQPHEYFLLLFFQTCQKHAFFGVALSHNNWFSFCEKQWALYS
jgi:hypothetical protein